MSPSSIPQAIASAAALALLVTSLSAHEEEQSNRFGDPYFQVSKAIEDGPEPRGPRITLHEQRTQAHHRLERGTPCWLRGECDRASAYAYDTDIADTVRQRWQAVPPLKDSTLWVTVQGRVIYFEGCAKAENAEALLEAFGRAVPDAQQAVAFTYAPAPGRRPPYAVFQAPGR